MGHKLFIAPLSDRDRLGVRIVTGHGMVEDFAIIYEARLAGAEDWTPLRRYDASHGVAHRHIFRPDGSEHRREFPGMTPAEAATEAERDLRANWRRYRRDYEAGSRP